MKGRGHSATGEVPNEELSHRLRGSPIVREKVGVGNGVARHYSSTYKNYIYMVRRIVTILGILANSGLSSRVIEPVALME